jgi:hypothetical protein
MRFFIFLNKMNGETNQNIFCAYGDLMHMCIYRIVALRSSSNVSWVKCFITKLHGAPMWSCGRIYLKNYHETLDKK